MEIIQKIKTTIKEKNLIEYGDRVIVGASGGPDSQFLIYALNELKEEFGFKLILAHLNHLHRQEASLDENIVKQTSINLKADFRLRQESMDDYAKKNKLSPEDAGRRLRYDFFYDIAKDYKNYKIALAHTKDDQAETLLLHMIRGAGIDGLAGMDFKKGSLIRPILDIRKKDLLKYLDEENISYATDYTNFEDDYTRNKVRLNIIPQLLKINPNIIDVLYNLSENSKDEQAITNEYISKLADKAIINRKENSILIDKKTIENLDDPIKRKLIRHLIKLLKNNLKDISRENTNEFISLTKLENGKKIIIGDLIFENSYKTYELYKSDFRKKDDKKEEVNLSLCQTIDFNGTKIAISEVTKGKKLERSSNIAYFDKEKLSFPLTVRTRTNGDRFKPLGMKNTKKIKDFFIDKKIDKKYRDKIPLILSKNDIIWVVGLRMSEDYKINSHTSEIVKIEVYNDNWI